MAWVLATALIGFISPVRASDPWPTVWSAPYGVYNPDHGSHTYCFGNNVSAAIKNRMIWSMSYMASNTDATTFEMSPCDTTSSAGQTDVDWRGGRLYDSSGNELIGRADCMRRFNNGLCDRYKVQVNGPFIREHYPGETQQKTQYRKTACHELGHTLGLPHYWSPHKSCQRSGWVGFVTNPWYRQWTGHHRGHINDWF